MACCRRDNDGGGGGSARVRDARSPSAERYRRMCGMTQDLPWQPLLMKHQSGDFKGSIVPILQLYKQCVCRERLKAWKQAALLLRGMTPTTASPPRRSRV